MFIQFSTNLPLLWLFFLVSRGFSQGQIFNCAQAHKKMSGESDLNANRTINVLCHLIQDPASAWAKWPRPPWFPTFASKVRRKTHKLSQPMKLDFLNISHVLLIQASLLMP
jgi:hypothetical protein